MAEENEKTPDNATPSGSSVNNPSPLKVLAQQKAKKSVTKTEKPEETSKNPSTADSEQSSSSRPRAETIEQRRRNAKVINWLSDHGKVPAASPMAPDQHETYIISDLPEAAVAPNSNVLEPVLIEGEYPGETIEVVDATDDMWAPAPAEPVINVERKKTVHIRQLNPEQAKRARSTATDTAGGPLLTKFVVWRQPAGGGGGGDGTAEQEPVVFEIEPSAETTAAVSGQRIEEDTRTVMDILEGVEHNGLMDNILAKMSGSSHGGNRNT